MSFIVIRHVQWTVACSSLFPFLFQSYNSFVLYEADSVTVTLINMNVFVRLKQLIIIKRV
jgi:hypothetical protein